MHDAVRVDIKGHVAEVTLNRPDKHNAVDLKMFEALIEAGESLSRNGSLRAVVLHGAGPSFCAGIDVSLLQGAELDPQAFEPRGDSPANFFQSTAYVWRTLPVPVIAAIHGVAYGAGLQIALGADVRYATPDARLAIMEVKWGLIPDMAITATLRHLAFADRVKELAFSGRIIDATEAEAAGLITSVQAHPLEVARALAEDIAAKSPDAVRAIKQLINRSWGEPEEPGLRLEAELQLKVMGTRNHNEAVSATREGRPPRFDDANS